MDIIESKADIYCGGCEMVITNSKCLSCGQKFNYRETISCIKGYGHLCNTCKEQLDKQLYTYVKNKMEKKQNG